MKKLKLNRRNLINESKQVINWWLDWQGLNLSTRPYACDDMIRFAKNCKLLESLKRWNKTDLNTYWHMAIYLQKAYCKWFQIPVITNKDVFGVY